MGSVGQSGSRTVVLGYSHHAAVALAIRDALGLDDLAVAVSRVCPAVPEITAVAEQRPLAPGGILDHLLAPNLPGLLTWSRQRKRDVAAASKPDPTRRLSDAIKAHEQATGSEIPAFRLQVTCLPVQGILFAPVSSSPVSPASVLVSTSLLHQRSDYHARILSHVTNTT